MQVTVRLFAAFRERAGASSLSVDLSDTARVADLLSAVVARAPALASVIGAARPVVNQEFVDTDRPLHPGDDVALLPPVSGGATELSAISYRPSAPQPPPTTGAELTAEC